MTGGNSKKILYVINNIDWFWSHRLPLAVGAREAGWDVNVAAPGAARDQALGDYGFKGYGLPPDEGFAPISAIKIILAIRQLLRETKPDLVHAITLKYAFFTGIAARLNKGPRCVFTIAGLGYLFSGEGFKPRILRMLVSPLLKYALKDATIITQNPDDQKLLIAGGFVTASQCVLIRGSGVDTEQFSPQPELEETNPPIVLMPARLVRDKGMAVFAEAARKLKKHGVEARFQIAGGIDARNPRALSKEEMENLAATGGVEWLGKVNDMAGLYARAAIVAYPSYYREGIPKVLLEAAAMGKAIVTTDHPGCREAVAHDINGFLVPVKDAHALAAGINALLNDPARRAAMGEVGRARALNEFDARLIVAQTLKTYN